MSNPGFIYILTNPSLAGIVKIGKTTRTPVDRVAELSSATGIPTPFQLVYFAEFEDCDAAERAMHALFTERNARVADNREFFRIAPHDAITALIQMPMQIALSISPEDPPNSNTEPLSLVGGLVEEGFAYWTGSGGRYQDVAKAISIFRNAADLGSAEACYNLGRIYRTNNEALDLQKAKIILQKGAELGSIECNAELASTFLDLGEKPNAEKAWSRYFSNAHKLSTLERGQSALECAKHIAMRGLDRQFTQILKEYVNDMAEYANAMAEFEAVDRLGVSSPKNLLDLAYYILFGTVPANFLYGRIKWFNIDKGLGFITGHDGLEYFLSFSESLCENIRLQDGQPVRFRGISLKQGLIAVNVLIQ